MGKSGRLAGGAQVVYPLFSIFCTLFGLNYAYLNSYTEVQLADKINTLIEVFCLFILNIKKLCFESGSNFQELSLGSNRFRSIRLNRLMLIVYNLTYFCTFYLGQNVAIKIIDDIAEALEEVKETRALNRLCLSHPNLPQFMGVYVNNPTDDLLQPQVSKAVCFFCGN